MHVIHVRQVIRTKSQKRRKKKIKTQVGWVMKNHRRYQSGHHTNYTNHARHHFLSTTSPRINFPHKFSWNAKVTAVNTTKNVARTCQVRSSICHPSHTTHALHTSDRQWSTYIIRIPTSVVRTGCAGSVYYIYHESRSSTEKTTADAADQLHTASTRQRNPDHRRSIRDLLSALTYLTSLRGSDLWVICPRCGVNSYNSYNSYKSYKSYKFPTCSLGSALVMTHRPGCRIHSPFSSKNTMASVLWTKILGSSKPWASMVSRTPGAAAVNSMFCQHNHREKKKVNGSKKVNGYGQKANSWSEANWQIANGYKEPTHRREPTNKSKQMGRMEPLGGRKPTDTRKPNHWEGCQR